MNPDLQYISRTSIFGECYTYNQGDNTWIISCILWTFGYTAISVNTLDLTF